MVLVTQFSNFQYRRYDEYYLDTGRQKEGVRMWSSVLPTLGDILKDTCGQKLAFIVTNTILVNT